MRGSGRTQDWVEEVQVSMQRVRGKRTSWAGRQAPLMSLAVVKQMGSFASCAVLMSSKRQQLEEAAVLTQVRAQESRGVNVPASTS